MTRSQRPARHADDRTSQRGAADATSRSRGILPPSLWTDPSRPKPLNLQTERRVPSDRTSRGWNRRTRVPVVPGVTQLIDIGLLAALCLVALQGFRVTYGGWGYLVVGAVGLLLGIVIGHLGAALRQPAIAALAASALVFFLLGSAVAMRATNSALPTPDTVRALTDVTVHGWKDLLTTLPPVGDTGALLVIPYLLGLIGGVAGVSLAERTRTPVAPLVPPVLILLAVILLGTANPASLLLQGAVFAALAVAWLAIRGRRARLTVRTATGNRSRLVTAGAMLVVAGVVATLAGPHLPGHDAHKRLVLRDYVTPPFDVSQFPSPLAAFRKYTKNGPLYDQTLFSVSGSGNAPVKIATLDDYDGTAWISSNTIDEQQGTSTFQRIGSRIDVPVKGTKVSGTLHIGPGYRDVWVPTVGTLTRVRFGGGDDVLRAFRYNLASGTGVLQSGVHDGDRIQFSAVLPTQSGSDETPFGEPVVSSDFLQFTRSKIATWAGDQVTPWAQLTKVGQWLHTNGKYSDGGNGESSEARYFAGHGLGRLSEMLNADEIVGDDEQYAALFALVANELGFPARVVLGGLPEADGTVQGKDVHAWIEVHLASGEWRTIPYTAFVPPTSQKPSKPPQTQEQTAEGENVPPPNTVKPPTTQQNPEEPQANAARSPAKKRNGLHVPLPSALLKILLYVGLPLLVLALIAGSIIGVKAWRRRRRRHRGTPSDRIAAGWQELLDTARDFGVTAPVRATRPEQARQLTHPVLPALAARADGGVFAAGVPSEGAVEAYWIDVLKARRALGHGWSPWRRVRAALSLRTFRRVRDRRPRRLGTVPAPAPG